MSIDPELIALLMELVLELLKNCPEQAAARIKKFGVGGALETVLLWRALHRAGLKRPDVKACLAYAKQAASEATDADIAAFLAQ
jgi:hypothetical protein